MIKNVCVLLSTYNGEKYLSGQLDSILKQKDVEVRILARDDGSTDSTFSILESWIDKINLSWYKGENLKPARSFMELLKNAGESPYYAFSDQDDFWMPEKLSVAIDALQQYDEEPALYFCQTQLVDKNLNKIDSITIHPYLTLGESLIFQFVSGCTMVINSKLRDMILSYNPTYISMHDLWIYCVTLSIGAKVVFDPIPHICYRQHDNNVVGVNTNHLVEWKYRIKNLVKGKKNVRSHLAQELMKGYFSQMPDKNKAIIDRFLKGKKNIGCRLKLLFDNNYNCSDKKTYWLFKLAVLMNTY